MAKSNKIGHIGVVKQVSEQTVEVVITSLSACSGCHAKGACGMADVRQKVITALKPNFVTAPGDRVMVYASTGNALFSVLLAYVVPTVLIIGVIAILTVLKAEETITATASLVAVAGYFTILYFNRKRIGKKVTFSVESAIEETEESVSRNI